MAEVLDGNWEAKYVTGQKCPEFLLQCFFYVLDFPTGRRLPSRGSTRKGAVVTAFAISVSVQKSTFFALIFRLL